MRFTLDTPTQVSTACSEKALLETQQNLYEALNKFSPVLCLKQDQHQVGHKAWLLEVSSCFRLFGGSEKLLRGIWNCASNLQSEVRLATHSTATGAWWLSKFRPAANADEFVQSIEQFASLQLQTLPSHCMDCPAEVLQTFEQCGLYTIGDLLKVPRAGFIQRFGLQALGELDSAFGIENAHAPTTAVFIPNETFELTKELPFHTEQLDLIERHTEGLLHALCTWLSNRKQSTRELYFEFQQAHGSVPLVLRSANATDQASIWLKLLHHRISQLKFSSDVRTVQLRCTHTETSSEQNHSLLPSNSDAQTNWTSTCDVLRARLGEQTVLFAQLEHDPRPEHSTRLSVEKKSTRKAEKKAKHFAQCTAQGVLSASTPRPLWLLAEPTPLKHLPHWNGEHGIRLLSGPERVEFGWWDAKPCLRDYYCAINEQGSMVWVYEDHLQPQAKKPRWYMHGVFA